ncbi:MAG TPA: trigger factor [Paenalcaligenes hominis]|uniref:Trigger factor n=1 Tax=Paenalcaligenes hominis TaxID=643674 RepID=A0A1U9JYJ1_9BURK|nr:trigger factor [Paenalcaligenes hominis]AQS50814.1 trigger factor [Paenalcaligenes hominis]NJB64234.1 trigger factor [Paenalcaligenes hominis]GGE69162.1 trigger factor [Paenalcaligenes hominis]HJH23568.1 trigger factor [Paenalcaligenes hominis]
MQPEVEILSGLERRIDVAISTADVEKEVQAQLKRVARTAKIQGFRPGKAPLSIVERSHGPSIRYDAINNELGKALDSAIENSGLRIAGVPSITPKEDAAEDQMVFSATFEVYPEITLPELDTLEVTRSDVTVGDAEVERTLDILRKQRANYEARDGREAQNDDRVTLDFKGEIDGVAFDGGTAEGFSFVLGQGRMLPEFEEATLGMKAGEEKEFPLEFPEDYGGTEVAGKTAQFTIKVTEVAEPVLPELNDDFAKELGQEEGNIESLLADVRANIEREAKARVNARTKASVMDALLAASSFDVPKALVQSEIQNRIAAARQELKQRGLPNADDMPIPEDVFQDEAERRVRLGLLLSALVESAELSATPEQVRARIEEFAQNYEQPEEVISFYLSDAQRRAEIEAIVLEDNVVAHIVSQAKVTDEDVDFEQLMGNN